MTNERLQPEIIADAEVERLAGILVVDQLIPQVEELGLWREERSNPGERIGYFAFYSDEKNVTTEVTVRLTNLDIMDGDWDADEKFTQLCGDDNDQISMFSADELAECAVGLDVTFVRGKHGLKDVDLFYSDTKDEEEMIKDGKLLGRLSTAFCTTDDYVHTIPEVRATIDRDELGFIKFTGMFGHQTPLEIGAVSSMASWLRRITPLHTQDY
jgi:hypothetical protein